MTADPHPVIAGVIGAWCKTHRWYGCYADADAIAEQDDDCEAVSTELEECDFCRDGCDVYECCVTHAPGRVTSWDYLCDRHRDHQGIHDCDGCCLACGGSGVAPVPTGEGGDVSVGHFLQLSEVTMLKHWARTLRMTFPNAVGFIHVGSSLTRKDWRDIDVRCVLPDDDFEMLAAQVDIDLLGLCVSLWGQRATGLPIDFQVQQMTTSQEFAGQRNGLGLAIREREGT